MVLQSPERFWPDAGEPSKLHNREPDIGAQVHVAYKKPHALHQQQ